LRPEIGLNTDVLRDNVRAWREHAHAALRVVIKSNGYGWGFETIVDVVDDLVDGYYVSDVDEFREVRALTQRSIATLTDVTAHDIAAILEAGGIPSVSSADAIDAADRWANTRGTRAHVRVPIRSAVGWSGIDVTDLSDVARDLALRALDVELSSHITEPSLEAEQTAAFDAAIATFQAAGVRVVGSDLASSLPLATHVASYSHVRLGIGLFGARFGSRIGVRSAIDVVAPIVETIPARGQRVGYGLARAPQDGYLTVLRCGYGDGFPRIRVPFGNVLATGMQFTTIHTSAPLAGNTHPLMNGETDLDTLADAAQTSVHELVVGLGRRR